MGNVVDDTELWHRVQSNNDERAFTAIYLRHSKNLYALAHNKLRDRQLAEDVVQEVFCKLWDNRHQAQITALEGYLAVAIRFLILYHLRKERTSKVRLATEHLPDVADLLNPEDFYNAKCFTVALKEQTAKLPGQCRLIFQYSRENGYKVAEIAQKMDLSPKTVEAQLAIALKKLKKAFHFVPVLPTLISLINLL